MNSTLIGSGEIDWLTHWDRFTHGVKLGTNAVLDATGHAFNSLAAAKDSIPTLEKVLRTARHTIDSTRFARESEGGVLETSAAERNIDKSIAAIDITRIFSDAYYFLSGDFIDDLRNWNFGNAFGSISFAIVDSIEAYTGVNEMMQAASDVQSVSDETKELLESISSYCVIGGYLGVIAESIRTLINTEGKDVQAWLDLASFVAAIAIPILTCCGITLVPVIVSLGLLSCGFSIASGIHGHYTKPSEGMSLDFANNNLGLGTVLAPIGSTAALTAVAEETRSLDSFVSELGPFRDLSAALAIFTRGKEWLFPKNGKRLWERASILEIGSKISATIQSSMDVVSWLGSMGAIESVKKNPIFKFFRSVFACSAAGLSAIDGIIKLAAQAPKRDALEFKMKKWELLTTSTGLGDATFLPGFSPEWQTLKIDLIDYYRAKMQRDIIRNGALPLPLPAPESELVPVSIAASAPTDAQDDSTPTALARPVLEDNRIVKHRHWNSFINSLSVNAIDQYFHTKQLARINSLEKKILEARADQPAAVGVRRQSELLALQNATGSIDLMSHKKALADWNFNKIDLEMSNGSWKLAQDGFKTAVATCGIASAIFGFVPGLGSLAISLLSTLVNCGKYFVEASNKLALAPELNIPAAAA